MIKTIVAGNSLSFWRLRSRPLLRGNHGAWSHRRPGIREQPAASGRRTEPGFLDTSYVEFYITGITELFPMRAGFPLEGTE